MKSFYLVLVFLLITSCKNDDSSITDGVGQGDPTSGCEGFSYPNWETSENVLPYPVGRSYTIGLSHCSGLPHVEGEPDQFAIDFVMPIGTLVTATRKGTIMFVEESGMDWEETNNMVVLRDEAGYFQQFQHLTHNGALVEEGQFVEKGDPIGHSGASGLAGYAHLHYVATRFGNWMPYTISYPLTFSNTSPNPKSLLMGETYEALPY